MKPKSDVLQNSTRNEDSIMNDHSGSCTRKPISLELQCPVKPSESPSVPHISVGPNSDRRNTCDLQSHFKSYQGRTPLSLEELEQCSVEDLMARMTAMLPPKQANKNTNNETEQMIATDKRSRDKCDRELGDSNTDDHNIASSSRRGKVDSTGGAITDTRHRQTVSDGGRSVRYQDYNKSSGLNNLYKKYSSTDQSNTLVIFQKVSKNITVNESYIDCRGVMTASQHYIINKSACLIQAYFRGYTVRKVTKHVLKKSFLLPPTKLKPRLKHSSKRKNKVSTVRNFSNVPINVANNFPVISEDTNKYVEHQQLIAESRIEPLEISKYRVTNNRVPDAVKPYIELVETGDLDEFVNSRGKEIEMIAAQGNSNTLQSVKTKTTNNTSHTKKENGRQSSKIASRRIEHEYKNTRFRENSVDVPLEERKNIVNKYLDKEVQVSEKLLKRKETNKCSLTKQVKVPSQAIHSKQSSNTNDEFLPLKPRKSSGSLKSVVRKQSDLSTNSGLNMTNGANEIDSRTSNTADKILTQVSTIDGLEAASEISGWRHHRNIKEPANSDLHLISLETAPPSTSNSSTYISEDIPNDDVDKECNPFPKTTNHLNEMNLSNKGKLRESESSSRDNIERKNIDPSTGLGASPAFLHLMAEADLLHQDAVAAAVQHLEELEHFRQLAMQTNRETQPVSTRKQPSHVSLPKAAPTSDSSIPQQPQDDNLVSTIQQIADNEERRMEQDRLRQELRIQHEQRQILHQEQNLERERQKINLENERGQLEQKLQSLHLDRDLHLQTRHNMLQERQAEQRQRLFEENSRLQEDNDRMLRARERINRESGMKELNKDLQREILIEQTVGVALQERHKYSALDSNLSLLDLELQAQESLNRLNREVRAKAESLFNMKRPIILSDSFYELKPVSITNEITNPSLSRGINVNNLSNAIGSNDEINSVGDDIADGLQSVELRYTTARGNTRTDITDTGSSSRYKAPITSGPPPVDSVVPVVAVPHKVIEKRDKSVTGELLMQPYSDDQFSQKYETEFETESQTNDQSSSKSSSVQSFISSSKSTSRSSDKVSIPYDVSVRSDYNSNIEQASVPESASSVVTTSDSLSRGNTKSVGSPSSQSNEVSSVVYSSDFASATESGSSQVRRENSVSRAGSDGDKREVGLASGSISSQSIAERMEQVSGSTLSSISEVIPDDSISIVSSVLEEINSSHSSNHPFYTSSQDNCNKINILGVNNNGAFFRQVNTISSGNKVSKSGLFLESDTARSHNLLHSQKTPCASSILSNDDEFTPLQLVSKSKHIPRTLNFDQKTTGFVDVCRNDDSKVLRPSYNTQSYNVDHHHPENLTNLPKQIIVPVTTQASTGNSQLENNEVKKEATIETSKGSVDERIKKCVSQGSLSNTLALLHSLQEEEDVNFQNHKSLLKLQVTIVNFCMKCYILKC